MILSVNSRAGLLKKILALSITSLYVGASRVHNFDQLRVLPFTKKDAEALKKLKRDPLLALFFKNFDDDGNWKPNGFI